MVMVTKYLTQVLAQFTLCLTGRKASSGVLSFLRVTGVARQPSPKLGRKTECIDSVRYTPQVDWDSLEGIQGTQSCLIDIHKFLFSVQFKNVFLIYFLSFSWLVKTFILVTHLLLHVCSIFV